MNAFLTRVPDNGGSRALVEAPLTATPVAQQEENPLNVVHRRRGVAFAVFLLVLAAGAAAVMLRPPVYEATALLMMSPREPEGVVSNSEQDRFRPPDSGYVDSQVEILSSPALAGHLVDALDLQQDPEWSRSGGDGDATRAEVVRTVAKAIEPKRRGQTYVVELGVSSRSPEKAARMANELVELYLSSRAMARIDSSERTRTWLTNRLEELRADLQEREGAVEAYRAEHGILSVGGMSFTEQQLQDAEASVLMARAEQAEREARLSQARALAGRGGSLETMAGALTSDVMAALRARQADVDRRLAEYAARYGPRHPSVTAARAEREDLARQISGEVSRLTENLNNEAEVTAARAGALQAHANSIRGELVQNNAQMVRLNELERGAAAARSVYEVFLQRNQELANGAAGVGGDAQLIAAASPPSQPASRSSALMLGIVFALAMVAGALAALLSERFSTRLETADDVERKLGAQLLTSIPQLRRRDLKPLPLDEHHPGGFVAANPRSAFAESIRLLRSRIIRGRGARRVKVVAIASSLSGEGKTSTALSLARIAAAAGQKVMLIDCDLRGRSLNTLLGIAPKVGIAEVLKGEAEWSKVVGCDEASSAHVLPAAVDKFTPQDIFGSEKMTLLLQELEKFYDLIVMDTPPVLALAEARDIAVLADGVVVVARRGRTTTHALRTALRELEAVGANVMGVAFNGIDKSAPGRTSYSDPLYFSHAQKAYTS